MFRTVKYFLTAAYHQMPLSKGGQICPRMVSLQLTGRWRLSRDIERPPVP
jgi:hypothetical protein